MSARNDQAAKAGRRAERAYRKGDVTAAVTGNGLVRTLPAAARYAVTAMRTTDAAAEEATP